MVEKKHGYVNVKRFLRETKVRLKNSKHEFFGRKGFVILDVHGNGEDDEKRGSISRVPKIAVDLGDIKIHVKDVDSLSLRVRCAWFPDFTIYVLIKI